MGYKEGLSGERPPRTLEIGEIPANLPSTYDAIFGEFGAPNLVMAPLLKDFQRLEENWTVIMEEEPTDDHVYKTFLTFFNAAIHDQKYGNTDWKNLYKKLNVLCAQGWLREQKAGGAFNNIDEFTIATYGQALKQHLVDSEQRWGVSWLTSDQRIADQNAQMIAAMEKHRKDYYTGETSGSEFYLNVGGDTLLRLFKLSVTHQLLNQWEATADNFAINW